MLKKMTVETVLNVLGNVFIVVGTGMTMIAAGRNGGKAIGEVLAKASTKVK